MKTKIMISVLFIALCGIVFAWQQFAYPQEWDEIQMGMSRQEVYDRTGLPTADTKDIKGAFWSKDKLTQRQELWIYFDKDQVTSFGVTQYVGTARHFHARVLRSSATP